MTATQTDDATAKLGAGDAIALASRASTVAIAKRGKVTVFLMKKERPDEKTLLTHMLGPTGNLRAPAIRKGRTLLIGFDPDMYERFLL